MCLMRSCEISCSYIYFGFNYVCMRYSVDVTFFVLVVMWHFKCFVRDDYYLSSASYLSSALPEIESSIILGILVQTFCSVTDF